MSFVTLILQIIAPAVLLCWLIFIPQKNAFGFFVQALFVVSYLIGVSLITIWSFPPWWVRSIYGAIFLTAVVWRFYSFRKSFNGLFPRNWKNRFWIGLLLSGSAAMIFIDYPALLGHFPKHYLLAEIDSPLGEGTYLVAGGGSHALVNQHFMTLNQDRPRLRKWRGQSYAIDLVKLDKYGLRSKLHASKKPSDYEIFGEPVLAPCDGKIIETQKSHPDMPVPKMDRSNMLGNYVIMECHWHIIVMAHFRQNSLTVQDGDFVHTGQKIAEVGNSGNSAEPHLHIHAQTWGSVDERIAGTPIMLRINGRYLARNDRLKIP